MKDLLKESQLNVLANDKRMAQERDRGIQYH